MPENDSFIANMPAITYVRMAAELSGLPEDAALERAHEVLFYVGLGEARYRKLGAYSLGMKQMAKDVYKRQGQESPASQDLFADGESGLLLENHQREVEAVNSVRRIHVALSLIHISNRGRA